ncbi:MAG: DNA polymerase III subunit gamma/tau [Planctomycetaceae bacterium]|nr:DNA polymerase III subunit gamma/tau [Planctomycetaceae bacterium]
MTTAGSHYTVLARRFRPQAFDDVVGQEHVARALQNAIRAGRVAHAYMFTGARGVGKTSTARILAKALNCPNAVDGVPCNQCEICQGISSGNDVDVLEIDGASNRGIDDIRSLRANVGVRSMRTQFKVYIIDEVHMLTKEAFNALLKTLEEPPPNVKFVFCTTEPNKVPDTILSRCQRFDFSSIADQSIADRLREIAKIEGFEVTEDALELVARRARGSMRDSQSLFDQLLAFSSGTVSADDVHRMLGTAGDDRLIDLFTAIVEHRPGEVLTILDGAFGGGVQPGELMDQCIGYVRDLMVIVSGGTSVPLCSVAARFRDTLQNQGVRLGMPGIMAAFQVLSDARSQMFRSTFARTVLEMAMVQVSLLENLSALADLLSGRLPSLPELPAASAASVATAGEKKNSDVASRSTPLIAPSPAAAMGIAPPPVVESEDEGDASEPYDDDSEVGDSPGSSASEIAPVRSENASVSVPAANSQPAHAPTPQPPVVTAAVETTPVAAVAPAPPQPVMIAAAEPAVAPQIVLTEETCGQLFHELIRCVGLTIAAGLKKATGLVLASSSRLEILVDSTADFAKKVLDVPENRARIESEVLRLTGRTMAIGMRPVTVDPKDLPVSAASSSPKAAAPSKPAPGRPAPSSKPAEKSAHASEPPQANLLGEIDPSRDPFIRRVMEAFGASVVRVTIAPSVRTADAEQAAE